jgi:hypothetical protein
MPSLTNNKKWKDPENVTNAFSHFFLTITVNLNLHQERKYFSVDFMGYDMNYKREE